jgi:cytochrome oxidase assembly protein ShyY1
VKQRGKQVPNDQGKKRDNQKLFHGRTCVQGSAWIIRSAAGDRVKRIALWLLALILVAGFVRAGFWQSGRADEKEALLARAAQVLAERRPVPLEQARQAMPAWVLLEGRFLDVPPLRLDNQRRGERVGVQVYRAFETQQGERLIVDLGWRPLPGNRSLPAESPLREGTLSLPGLLVPPPSAGFAIGPALSPAPDGGWLALRLDAPGLRTALGRPSDTTQPQVIDSAVLRLDPAIPLGYERDLDLLPNTLPPEKHRGYALQWFGFAAGLLLLSLYLQVRRP